MHAIRFIITIIFSLFFYSHLYAEDCNTTVTAAITEQLSCSDNDSLIVTGSISYNNQNAVLSQQLDGVTITNFGTI